MAILPDANGDVKFVGEKWGTRAKSDEKGILETTAQRGSPSSEFDKLPPWGYTLSCTFPNKNALSGG
jgi:hypothetical protein